jgi:hypothetical protein
MTVLPIRRREFIAVLGGAAAWPMMARGQQQAISITVSPWWARADGRRCILPRGEQLRQKENRAMSDVEYSARGR